ncbi:hypothetical protein THASP1DRAFT_22499 [Thamnocephalis sphaerospora]|uniref:Arrestin-like N-terminal domain-containing protein n=1 Tax=Thamnocephalis sphaerospora TaxID=78915 RepID=A0A4P9XU05_9FUNG|nr:hypothetical protein THASP1DRAFT_22499 [Thamnocephalis sphaerospora]|eukprot:RKP09688.1 hypothetical protein THASP1DRAFT_22499 [Thamnocephalis sphaerospora]
MSIDVFSVEPADESKCAYFPGDIVRGYVRLELRKAMPLQRIRVQLLGSVRNKLQLGSEAAPESVRRRMRSDSGYGNSMAPVIPSHISPDAHSNQESGRELAPSHSGRPPGGSSDDEGGGADKCSPNPLAQLEAGKHSWPFIFRVPSTGPRLPSSVDGTYNYIRYKVRATLLRPFGYCDVSRDMPIRFLDSVDVSAGDLRTPMQFYREMTIAHSRLHRLVGIRQSPATHTAGAWASIERMGYRAGESIRVLTEVHHTQPCFISDAVKVQLVQKRTLKAGE